MDRFENQVLAYIRENELLKPGAHVAAGLSGGADSVCLLHVLKDLQRLLKLSLLAVHVHHGIRGPEADRDEAFCRRLAQEWGIGYRAVYVDAPALARREGLSLEEAARQLRYEALRKAAAEWTQDPVLIAVAHHADDQAETILFNMLRGSGLRGIGGMVPARDGIIRPLLGVSRGEILKYLEARGLPYVTDSTNLENDQTRNRLRNEILPALTSGVNARAAEHICSLGRTAREADEFLRSCALEFLEGIEQAEEAPAAARSFRLGQQSLKEKPQILRRYVIIEALRRLGVPLKDWGELHLQEIDRALFAPKGWHVDLPHGVYAENAYRETFLYRLSPTGTEGGEKDGI